jgi:hypothetical protein
MSTEQRRRVMVIYALYSSGISLFGVGLVLYPLGKPIPLGGIVLLLLALLLFGCAGLLAGLGSPRVSLFGLTGFFVGIFMGSELLSRVLNLTGTGILTVIAGIASVGFWAGWIVLRSHDAEPEP